MDESPTKPAEKLMQYVAKHASHDKCNCGIVKTSSGYYKQHVCHHGKRRVKNARITN